MSQAENSNPEVVHIAIDHLTLRQRMGRKLAIFAMGAGAAAYIASGLPNPFGVVEDFVDGVGDVAGEVWDGAGEILGQGKGAADEVASDISGREEQPLLVDPKDVIMGAVVGQTAFGKSEREYYIDEASKKYNGWMPGGDEVVELKDAIYVGEAYLPGAFKLSGTDRNITVTLSPPRHDMDTKIRKQPTINDKPQLLADIGQLPGGETNPEMALEELNAYAKMLEANDTGLIKTAACWGIQTVEGLLIPVLSMAGFEVLTDGTLGKDGNPSNDLELMVRAPLTPIDNIYYEKNDCAKILSNEIPALQDETFVLPPRIIKNYKLKQEDK